MDISFQNWISDGKRIPYNYKEKRILLNSNENTLSVFQKKISQKQDSQYCITFLSGYPDGSFGWAKVEHLLYKTSNFDRLYVEYVGQGDSDKPENYSYSTIERADLVEAHWQHQQIENTFIVAFDYSSLVVMELLRRQQEKESKVLQPATTIDKVLYINGGYFTDAHSHPYLTTPFLKSKIGKMSTQLVQKSKLMFVMYLKMIKNMWSKDYNVSKAEIDEFYKAVTHRNGATFMSNAGGFVEEHKNKYAKRWDLESIYHEMKNDVSFHIVGSEEDIFEPKQLIKAEKRLGIHGVDIRRIQGGHFITLEQPEIISNIINELSQQITI